MPSSSVNNGVGCMAIFPATLVGFAGLTDGIGPKGLRGISELSGWLITCLVTAGLLGLILARGNRAGALASALTFALVAGMAALAYKLLNWLCLDAPMLAKILFTSSMQFIGAAGLVLCSALLAKILWKNIRER